MIFRVAQYADLHKILVLYHQLFPIDLPQPSEHKIGEVWQQILNNSAIRCFVIEYEDNLIAMCTITITPSLSRGCRSYALIENVVTHENYRRQGVGRMLIKGVIKYAWQNNCYKIMLLSNKDTLEAYHFYHDSGFESSSKKAFTIRNSLVE